MNDVAIVRQLTTTQWSIQVLDNSSRNKLKLKSDIGTSKMLVKCFTIVLFMNYALVGGVFSSAHFFAIPLTAWYDT